MYFSIGENGETSLVVAFRKILCLTCLSSLRVHIYRKPPDPAEESD